jgi:uncharacterized protein YhjY with autotransporter beta-barrel domain
VAAAAATGLTAAQRDLAQQCAFFADPNASPTSLGTGYAAILGQQLDALGPQVKTFASGQDMGLTQRLAQLRQGEQGVSLSGLGLQGIHGLPASATLADLLPLGGGAGSPAFLNGRLGLFINGNYREGSKDATANSFAFDVNNTSVTAGADYRCTDWLVAGLAYEGGVTHFDYTSSLGYNLGYMDLRNNGLNLYASIYKGSFYLDLLAGYGLSHLNSDRHLAYTNTTVNTTIEQYAMGSSQLHNLSAGMSVGGELHWHALEVNPEGSLTYHESNLGAYTEAMSHPTDTGGGLALSYAKTDLSSLQARVGLHVGTTLSTPWGVLQPQIHGAYVRELHTASDTFTARFAAAEGLGGGGDTPLYLQTDTSRNHYFADGAGVRATLARGFSAFIDYEQLRALAGVKSNEFSFGVRFQAGD